MTAGGNALLEAARTERAAVRFWYRPTGEPFTFLSWALVLGRAWVAGVGQDGVPRPELDWQLQAVARPEPTTWPNQLVEQMVEGAAAAELAPVGAEARATVTYGELLARLAARGDVRRPNGVVRADFARSAAAKRAVLLRAGGRCESPRCTGMPAEKNRRGESILDVDHIEDLALGGADHPTNMVALCPNCHACKTRGAQVAMWRRELKRVALAADLQARAAATPVP